MFAGLQILLVMLAITVAGIILMIVVVHRSGCHRNFQHSFITTTACHYYG